MSKLEKESEKAKARLEIDGVIVDCWSALILVSQGRCLGKPASFLLFQLPSLSNSWPNLATWTHFSIFFLPLANLSSCIHPSQNPSPLIFFLSYYWGLVPLSIFLSFHLFLQTSQASCREQWTGKEQREMGESATSLRVRGESAAGQGVGERGQSRIAFSFSNPLLNNRDYCACSCSYRQTQRRI